MEGRRTCVRNAGEMDRDTHTETAQCTCVCVCAVHSHYVRLYYLFCPTITELFGPRGGDIGISCSAGDTRREKLCISHIPP